MHEYSHAIQRIFQCHNHRLRTVFESILVYFALSGFETEGLTTAVWPGGETEALMRLERHLERKVKRRLTTQYIHKIRNEYSYH